MFTLVAITNAAYAQSIELSSCTANNDNIEDKIKSSINNGAFRKTVFDDDAYHDLSIPLSVTLLQKLDHFDGLSDDSKTPLTSYLYRVDLHLLKDYDGPKQSALSIFTIEHKPALNLFCNVRTFHQNFFSFFDTSIAYSRLDKAKISSLKLGELSALKLEVNTNNEQQFNDTFFNLWLLIPDGHKWKNTLESSWKNLENTGLSIIKYRLITRSILGKQYPALILFDEQESDPTIVYVFDGDQFYHERFLINRYSYEYPRYQLLNRSIKSVQHVYHENCDAEGDGRTQTFELDVQKPYFYENRRLSNRVKKINTLITNTIPFDFNQLNGDGLNAYQKLDYKILIEHNDKLSIEFFYQYGHCIGEPRDFYYRTLNVNPNTGQVYSALEMYGFINKADAAAIPSPPINKKLFRKVLIYSIISHLKSEFIDVSPEDKMFTHEYWSSYDLDSLAFSFDSDRMYAYFGSCQYLACAYGAVKLPILMGLWL